MSTRFRRMPEIEGSPPPIPAATVVIVRDGTNGVDVLMLHRSPHVGFGGMWVFPGGRVERSDGLPSGRARMAATREVAEETNIVLDPATLVPYARWSPPAVVPKRFDTVFFVARAGDAQVNVDGEEIRHYEWAEPREFLARHASGEVELAPPTWVTLWRLGAFSTATEVLLDAKCRPLETFVTHLVSDNDDHDIALWHGDVAYEAGPLDSPGPRHRLYMNPGEWRYERT